MKEFLIYAILKESNILRSILEFKSLESWRGRPLNYKVNFLLHFISLSPQLFCKTCSSPELSIICPPSTTSLIVLCSLCFILQASLVPMHLGAHDVSAFPLYVSTFTEENSAASYMCNMCFCRKKYILQNKNLYSECYRKVTFISANNQRVTRSLIPCCQDAPTPLFAHLLTSFFFLWKA